MGQSATRSWWQKGKRTSQRFCSQTEFGDIFSFFFFPFTTVSSLTVNDLKLWVKKKKHTFVLQEGLLAFQGGRKKSVLCSLFSLYSRSMNSSQCLSLPIIISPSSTICKTDVLEMAFGFICLFKHKQYFFFKYESTDTCWIFYLESSSCTCEITSVQTLVLLSSGESTCQSYKAKINELTHSLQLIVAI